MLCARLLWAVFPTAECTLLHLRLTTHLRRPNYKTYLTLHVVMWRCFN